MIAVQFAVVLAAIFVGARLGGIAIGFAGGLGVLVLALLGVKPGEMPLDVVSIIMAVIVAIAAMQVAGGMDYLVDLADRILRRNPRHLTFLAPIITYLMTLMAGTGHTAFSTMPVIIEVAKENADSEPRQAVATLVREEHHERAIEPKARLSVLIFLVGLLSVMGYATAISKNVGLITDPVMTRDQAIIAFMLSTATIIVLACKASTNDILSASTFRSGMSAAICVLGVAWMGTTFVSAHEKEIMSFSGDLLSNQPWLLAVVLVFASALLYSQAATTKALIPTALAIGVAPFAAVAAFPAVSALFILPTYPTLLAAVQMDDTGTTQIGKAVFNHPLHRPGADQHRDRRGAGVRVRLTHPLTGSRPGEEYPGASRPRTRRRGR